MKELRRNSELLYILEEDENEALFFTVTCGGVAMYDVKIQLNVEERAQFLEQGDAYLNKLAIQIGKNTAAFRTRAIT